MIDYKKTQKQYYSPPTSPQIVDVEEMKFITAVGEGDPNTSEEYKKAIELLYGLSYTIKMNSKAILEYVVFPLEGLWHVDDDFKGGGESIRDKSKFVWKMMIRQPEFVSDEIFEAAKKVLAKKKADLDTTKAKLETITEGLCVQVMHIGPYDEETASVLLIDNYATNQGYELDFENGRQHHEIYISDPRKTAPAKLKTVLRHPIK